MTTGPVRIRLSAAEHSYLEGSGFLAGPLLEIVRSAGAEPAGRRVVEVPRELVEEFRAAFTDRLARVGFDATYEPTAEGRRLESLIDRFFLASGRPERPGKGR